MNRASILILAVFWCAPAMAQTVEGVVADSTGAALSGATVVVLQEADSALVRFGITRADGAFKIARIPPGSYLLQVSFVGYVPQSRSITMKEAPLDVGQIRLAPALLPMNELVISAEHIPMVIKRDTIEYNAAAFRVRPNANVEELLRKLPGVEVEQDGTIKAQGETVENVLVDGKEFFGNDPTVATRNLPADAVDRVQVYDKRSDAAEFTGVDDGEEEMTINLALKEDRRQGYFGNITNGLGDPMRYESRAGINRFSPETQLSVISNLNNINQQSFGMQEYVQFMGGIQSLMSGGRLMMEGVPIGQDAGAGFSTTLSGGVNFNHDFTKKTSLRSSYLGYYLDNDQDRDLRQQQLVGGPTAALSNRIIDQESRLLSHRLNVNLKHVVGEGHDVQLRSNLQVSGNDLGSLSNRETFREDALQNDSRADFSSDGEALHGDATLTYRRRLAPGRTIAATLSSSIDDRNTSGKLRAINRFYEEGNILTTEEIDQLQEQLGNTRTHSERLNYTEPVGRRQLFRFSLEHRTVLEDQERDISAPISSTGFSRTYRYYTGGIDFRRSADPTTVRVGIDVQQADLYGRVRGAADAIDRGYLRLLPSASISHSYSEGRDLELRYEASTREPSMRDLQPFEDNSDPLNVYVGNPNLRPEYVHSGTLRYLLFDRFSFVNFLALLRASYTFDRIVGVRTIDDNLRQTLSRTNADGDWAMNGSLSFGAPVRPLGIRANISTRSSYNRGVEFVNGGRNDANLLRSTWDIRIENRDKDRLDASIGARYTFNDVRYSVNSSLNQSYVNRTFYSEVTYEIGRGWRIGSEFEVRLYTEAVFGSARRVPLWHAELSRIVMSDRVEIKLAARDLLNQNLGVSYNNTSAYIEEERIATLGRYVMLQVVYSLSRLGPRDRMIRM